MKTFRRLKVGSSVGDFAILRAVAELRGRHPVYLAWSNKDWCPVALKCFRSREDAERELQILHQVNHPNIVRGFSIARPKFLIMEYLDGPTLRTLIHDAPPSASDVLRIGVHIGAALARIHSAGLLHLDVKPGNVIIRDGQPVLIDLGAVRPIGYRAQHLIGTDGYIAPEVRAGQPLGTAADVYGLGASIIESLTRMCPTEVGVRAQVELGLRAKIGAPLRKLLLESLAEDPLARPNLDVLLVALNAAIRRGPKMWPAEVSYLGPQDNRAAA